MARRLTYIACAIASAFASLSFSSCAFLKSDYEMIDDKIAELVANLESSNREGIKRMFAKSKIEKVKGFEASVEALVSYYDGAFVSKRNQTHGKFGDKHGDFRSIHFLQSFDVTTTAEEYRFAFYLCTEYTTDRDSLGIWSLYIIKKKDDPRPTHSYFGDGFRTPGINIGKVYDEKQPKGDHWDLDR